MAMQTATATFTGVSDTVVATWPAMNGTFGVNWGLAIGAITNASAGPVSADISGLPTTTGATVRVTDPLWSGSVTILLFDMP